MAALCNFSRLQCSSWLPGDDAPAPRVVVLQGGVLARKTRSFGTFFAFMCHNSLGWLPLPWTPWTSGTCNFHGVRCQHQKVRQPQWHRRCISALVIGCEDAEQGAKLFCFGFLLPALINELLRREKQQLQTTKGTFNRKLIRIQLRSQMFFFGTGGH